MKASADRLSGIPSKAADLRASARRHGLDAMRELFRLATTAESEQVRVAAIREILDRGHGKAALPLTGEGGEGPVLASLRVEFVGAGLT